MKKFLFLLFLISITYSFSRDKAYFTGPLLTPSADNLEPNQMNLQPYIYVIDNYAKYDSSWHHLTTNTDLSINSELYVQLGLLKFLDVTFDFFASYNKLDDIDSFEYGDTTVTFGLQILKDEKGTFKPSIRLCLEETFPTGKYKKLNPNKNGIDSSGSGSYETGINLVFSKIVYFIKNHPINLRLSFNQSIPTKVKVEEFNTYGGGFNTSGKVRPPFSFVLASAFEFSFTKHFIYAMDFVYQRSSSTKFHGENGTDQYGNIASNTSGSSVLFSMAPALEYGFTENLGILAGAWFSVFGKNSKDFKGGVASVTYTF